MMSTPRSSNSSNVRDIVHRPDAEGEAGRARRGDQPLVGQGVPRRRRLVTPAATARRRSARARPCRSTVARAEPGTSCARAGESALADERLVAAARAAGLALGVWTVNDVADIRRMLDLGVDIITSDRPDLAKRLQRAGA